jgi:hypothetical protein
MGGGWQPSGLEDDQPPGWQPDSSGGGGGGDTTPDAFGFVPQTGVALSTFIVSAPLSIPGLDAPTTISVLPGADYSLNGGGFTTADGTYDPGTDTVQMRLLSSALEGTPTVGTLVVGGVQGTFTVTTLVSAVAHRVRVAIGGNQVVIIAPADTIEITIEWAAELTDGVTLQSVAHDLPTPLELVSENTESGSGLSRVKLRGAQHGVLYQIGALAQLSSSESIRRVVPARALNG